jgi:hypothetical protein
LNDTAKIYKVIAQQQSGADRIFAFTTELEVKLPQFERLPTILRSLMGDCMWENSSYCWAVTCKNHIYHIPRNFIYKHKILLAEADAVTSRPPVTAPFKVRRDMCGKEYVYRPSDVL